jgi:hypothetical protein
MEIFLPAVLSSAMLHAQNLPSAATCRQCPALEAAYGPWPASLWVWARMDLNHRPHPYQVVSGDSVACQDRHCVASSFGVA